MTEDKARKRSVRARMSKTGESYTAARRHVVKASVVPKGIDLGKSDESIEKGSGKPWAHWFSVLDAWGATKRTHTEIARYVNEELGVPGWWAQTVTVGYERGRGMRGAHQRTDGAYYVTVSKTFPVGVQALFEAFTDTKKRNRWLESGTLWTRTSRPAKSARFDFEDGQSRVNVTFESKAGNSKATVSVEHQRLDDGAAVEKMRAFWKDRLAELGRLLGS